VDSSTFYRWLKKGARHKRLGKETRYSRFSRAVEKAMAYAYMGHVGTIAAAAKGRPAKYDAKGRLIEPAMIPSWQASMTWLERNYPREYARRTYRIEEEHGPQAAVGAVVPYAVRMPEVDPLVAPSPVGGPAPPHPEAARENGIQAEDVKCKGQDSDTSEPSGGQDQK
jgi:hypothetical protein